MISWGETDGIPEDGEVAGSFIEVTCNAAGITSSLSRDISASSAAGKSRGASFFASSSALPEGWKASSKSPSPIGISMFWEGKVVNPSPSLVFSDFPASFPRELGGESMSVPVEFPLPPPPGK